MLKGKVTLLATMALTTGIWMAPAAQADAIVNVSLLDKGGEMDLSKSLGLGMGMKGDMKMAIMSMKLDKATVPAAKVTFKVKNDSKETVHEMIASHVKDASQVVPFLDNENRVDEDKNGDLGEVSELDPGKAGELTLDLKPGTYLLFCNVPGHYMAGMWAALTVK